MLIVMVLNFFFLNMVIVIKSLFKSIFLLIEKAFNVIERKVKTFIEKRAEKLEIQAKEQETINEQERRAEEYIRARHQAQFAIEP